MAIANRETETEAAAREGRGVWAVGPETPAAARVRLDGKFLRLGGRRVRVQGVTYGPFAPDAAGDPFPATERVRTDFAMMRGAGVNGVRTYHVPPARLFDAAEECGLSIFVDVPWPKHVCFLGSARAQAEGRRAVRLAAQRGRGRPGLLAYSIGNEIPPDVVRWHGARRVERFLAELCDTARQVDPEALVTYANFPPTEYLDLSPLDFTTFNVYLHDREAFRRYLLRLQNLVGERPLVLGEIGMDTLRNGERGQADFLRGHLGEAALAGLAGAFVFSWTDDWHTGGHPIEDWAFGVTRRDRSPKASYHALGEVFGGGGLAARLDQAPRVSVVVCSHNGGRTLDTCLRSLGALDYPDYEVILVDDGSTDGTRAIAARFPEVRTIHQPNLGLSMARNVGLRASNGSVVAYTDSDCVADPDWLTLLVQQLQRSGASAVGGPNLSPDDGAAAACVGASPGQPTHVLESDQVAEHIPGCNMAFRREALLAINGFDPLYRKAGDDVDVCWRLEQAGMWITFAPGAFVWHHRRQTPGAYLRQQAGYGEAEALLRFKHPDRFNGRGDGKWRGVLYGASLRGLRLSEAIVYRGTFGSGLFQCVYQPGPAHWAMLPSSLEWHAAAALVALAGAAWGPALPAASAVMLALSVLVAVVQAAQARLPRPYDGLRSRALVAALCYAQPLVRSWARYRTRWFAPRPASGVPDEPPGGEHRLPLTGARVVDYWSEQGVDRTALLGLVVAYLDEHRWGKVVDSGWSDWDLEIHGHRWTSLRVLTAQEEHGGGRRLIRVRYSLRASAYLRAILAASAASALAVAASPVAALTASAAFGALGFGLWCHGTRRASAAARVFDTLAGRLEMIRCTDTAREDHGSAPAEAQDVPAAGGARAVTGVAHA
jgi:GT2 family glycosyltransferase